MEDVCIRLEREEDWREAENMTREAFWNHHSPGCDEHYLLHMMRSHADYIPALNFVAEKDGRIVGNIVFTRCWVEKEGGEKEELLLFGPLSVLPAYQRKGVGSALVHHAAKKAKEMGYRGIIIFGSPDYYSRLGFQPAKAFGITDGEGKYPAAHQVLALYDGAMEGMSGRFVDSDVLPFRQRARGRV